MGEYHDFHVADVSVNSDEAQGREGGGFRRLLLRCCHWIRWVLDSRRFPGAAAGGLYARDSAGDGSRGDPSSAGAHVSGICLAAVHRFPGRNSPGTAATSIVTAGKRWTDC